MQKDSLKVTTNEVADVKMRRKGEEQGSGGKSPEVVRGRNQIDDNLRRVYDDMLDDEVPSRFEELLRKLREQDDK